MRLAFPILAAGLMFAPLGLPARADTKQVESFAVWHKMQECAKQANMKFPDHTPDGNAKREAARQECLRAHHLPVTNPVATPAR